MSRPNDLATCSLTRAKSALDQMTPEDRFVFAASCGDTSRILHLSNQGVSVNSRFSSTGSSALCRAARHGRYDVCRLLVRLGAHPDDHRSGNDMALHCASRGGYTEIVSFLLSAGARVNSLCDGQTATHVAARWGRRSVLEQLWEHGADFETGNSEGRNVAEEALHWSEDETYNWIRNRMTS